MPIKQSSVGLFENYKRELAFILFRRWRSMTAIALGIMVVSIAIALFWPPIWGAEGALLIKGKKADRNPEMLEQSELRESPVTKEDLYSEIEILTSNQVLQLTLKALESRGETQILQELGKTPASRLERLKGMLETKVVPTSNVIDVRMTSQYRGSLVKLLDVLFENYINARQDIFSPDSVNAFLGAQLNRFQQELKQKDQEIAEFLGKTGVTATNIQIENNLILKRDLATTLSRLESEAIDLKNEIEHIEKLLLSKKVQFFPFIQIPGIVSLSGKLQEAVAERENVGRIYRPETGAVLGYDQSIRNLYEQLRLEVASYADNLRSKLVVTNEKVKELRNRVRDLDQQNVSLRQNQLTLTTMERESQVIGKSYETFLQRNQQSVIQTQKDTKYIDSYVSILTQPELLPDPIFPRYRQVIFTGVLAGLILALTIGFLQEYFDHTFKRPEEVERIIGLPVLVSIPLLNSRSDSKILEGSQPPLLSSTSSGNPSTNYSS